MWKINIINLVAMLCLATCCWSSEMTIEGKFFEADLIVKGKVHKVEGASCTLEINEVIYGPKSLVGKLKIERSFVSYNHTKKGFKGLFFIEVDNGHNLPDPKKEGESSFYSAKYLKKVKLTFSSDHMSQIKPDDLKNLIDKRIKYELKILKDYGLTDQKKEKKDQNQ